MDSNDSRTAPPSIPPQLPRPPRRIVTYAILGGAVVTLIAVLGTQRQGRAVPARAAVPNGLLPVPRAPEPPDPLTQAPAQRPQVELVFALDTTGSMSGLIEGAKQKIWSLASFVAQGQPTPDLRVGLIAYRDVGDAYVTRVFDLDSDLDRVYRRLRSFQAEGGGDAPEHVARALDESVHKMSWSKPQSVVKVIYLVGDAPPHTDYQDGYDYARAARAAAGKGIQLHTILCGGNHEAEVAWRKIASLGGGEYMAIHQDGGVQAEHSRYDDELAKLHDKLGTTAIAYGASAPVAVAELEAHEEKAAKEGAEDGFDVAAKKALRKSVRAKPASGLSM